MYIEKSKDPKTESWGPSEKWGIKEKSAKETVKENSEVGRK